MATAKGFHPITRASMSFNLWSLASLGGHGDQIEAPATASRIVASDGSGADFAPLAMGGAGGLRASGSPAKRLARWLDGLNCAILTAVRTLDDVEVWTVRAENIMAQLSGRTPVALRKVFAEWPLVSAPMAEAMTGASRAAIQKNLIWMDAHDLIQEVTGQSCFRMSWIKS